MTTPSPQEKPNKVSDCCGAPTSNVYCGDTFAGVFCQKCKQLQAPVAIEQPKKCCDLTEWHEHLPSGKILLKAAPPTQASDWEKGSEVFRFLCGCLKSYSITRFPNGQWKLEATGENGLQADKIIIDESLLPPNE